MSCRNTVRMLVVRIQYLKLRKTRHIKQYLVHGNQEAKDHLIAHIPTVPGCQIHAQNAVPWNGLVYNVIPKVRRNVLL